MHPSAGAIDALRTTGLRATPQRLVIFALLSGRTDHPTAEDLYHDLHSEHPTLSLSTVYATLDSLEKVGLCRRVNLGEGKDRYEGPSAAHPHLACLSCHSVIDLPPSEQPVRDDTRYDGYVIAYTTVTHYGYCPKCQSDMGSADGKS